MSMKMRDSGNTKRDILILATIVVLVVGAYLAVRTPTAQPDRQQAAPQDTPSEPVGSMDEAMRMLDELPQDFGTLVQQGNQFMDEGHYAVAAEVYRRALGLQAAPDVRVDYGACLHAMGLPLRAIEEFRTVVESHPEHGIATFNLGIVYFDQQQPDSAQRYFRRYLEIDPDGPAAAQAQSLLQQIGS
jgi:tetratricopeptide (TPR) repeat protein